jgi:D-3-phosphoglycerate dehydrogenase
MSKLKAVVVNLGYESYDVERNILGNLDFEVVPAAEDCTTEEQVIAAAADADAVLVREAPMGRRVIEALSRCKAIVRYGVGVDNIDLEAARERRIYVANVPGYGTEEVSDHAAALLLGCIRTLLIRDTRLRQGKFETDINDELFRTTGKTLGLVGYGKISQALHRKWKGFLPAEVLVYDPFVENSVIKEQGGKPADMATLLSESDYISLHTPLTPDTRHIIDESALRMMKPTAIIVNTARGELIDEKALVDALNDRRILAVGLDVFEKEPISQDNPLLRMPNVILSGHTGWYSKDSVLELQTRAAQEIRRVFEGSYPEFWLNPWSTSIT